MKALLSSVIILLFINIAQAQQQYTVNGQSYTLKTKVEGTLTLLWNTIDGEYRYFSKKGNTIEELKNTRVQGDYQEEFKTILKNQTTDASVDVEDVKLTLPSLTSFYNEYNKQVNPDFVSEKNNIQLSTRLGAFAGISNSVYSSNPENKMLAVAGIEFELLDQVKLKRHSVVVQFRQTFENADYSFSSSQFSLNYRFKFVKSSAIDVFVNTKFATYTYVKREVEVIENDASGGDLQAPVLFGLGADIALGKGYLTLSYNDIVGLSIDSNGEFPIDFTVGYKFNL